MLGPLRIVQYVRKSSILLAGKGVRKISSVACGFSPIKIHFSDYLKSLISRINDSDILLKKTVTSFITVCFAAITLVFVFAWFL